MDIQKLQDALDEFKAAESALEFAQIALKKAEETFAVKAAAGKAAFDDIQASAAAILPSIGAKSGRVL